MTDDAKMMPQDKPLKLEDLAAFKKYITDRCGGIDEWHMRVPVEDDDTDMVFCRVLKAAEAHYAALSKQPAAVDADRDPLVDRLTGRAAYLDSFGSVKDRDLMHSAAQEITALRNALAKPQGAGVKS